ncbi:MAG: ABC transporter permease [Phycisphaerae bacterium]|nr:ABC transporter permease [Phycisphaerae bacterium]
MDGQQTRRNPIESAGAKMLAVLSYAGGMVLLLGSMLRWAFRGMFSPKIRFGREALAAQMVRVGVRSLGIVVLVQVFIGVILALQMAPPLEKFAQEGQVSIIIGVAGFRMLGPIITAVVLSGFAGASIAAELGTMVVAEEIEAMEAMAMNPVRFLVVPRVLATFVMTIFLVVIADLMIALGGYFTARLVLGPAVHVGYWDRMREQLEYRDFYTGLIMAGVFGVLISLIACYEGLKVKGGAEGVGRATTMTVVYSIVAIISAACVFTMIFYVFEL